MKPLTDGRTRLVPLTRADAAFYIELANHPDIRERVNNIIPYGPEQFDELLGMMAANPHVCVWLIEYAGAPCGVITFGPLLKSPQLFQGGYWLLPEVWGRGIATTALMLVTNYLFKACGAQRIQALVEPENKASCRVLEKAGFHHEGLLRRYYPSRYRGLLDVHMYARVLAS